MPTKKFEIKEKLCTILMRGIRFRAGYATRDSLASANAMAFQPAQELTQKTKTPHVYEMNVY